MTNMMFFVMVHAVTLRNASVEAGAGFCRSLSNDSCRTAALLTILCLLESDRGTRHLSFSGTSYFP